VAYLISLSFCLTSGLTSETQGDVSLGRSTFFLSILDVLLSLKLLVDLTKAGTRNDFLVANFGASKNVSIYYFKFRLYSFSLKL
jgi:hypothetical protein